MSAHIIRQEPPWPPHPESLYMLSRFTCSCGWNGHVFKDLRGSNEPRLSRETAEIHAREAGE